MITTTPLLVLREEAPPEVSGRTLICRLCTYGKIYQPSPTLRERVLKGAFKSPLARPSGVLRYRHNGEKPGDSDDLSQIYGMVTALREEDNAVLADIEIFTGEAGDKIMKLAESGAISGVSMAAIVAESTKARDGVLDIRRVSQINGVSLTPTPAYDDAQVLALREQSRISKQRLAQERAWWGLPR